MIWINPSRQTLTYQKITYSISTSKHGLGEREDSYQTPRGWHSVSAIIGTDQPLYRQFVGRMPAVIVTPLQWPSTPEDLILSRIIRLSGLEPGLNQGPGIDSYERYIYLHGTADEHLLGSPASKGCIRMANQAIVELANNIALGEKVWIHHERPREHLPSHETLPNSHPTG